LENAYFLLRLLDAPWRVTVHPTSEAGHNQSERIDGSIIREKVNKDEVFPREGGPDAHPEMIDQQRFGDGPSFQT